MQVIVDANPLISIIIKPGKAIDLLFTEELELFAPTLLIEEIQRNKEEIIKKSGLSEEEVNKFLKIILKRIKLILEEDFINYREKAEDICPHKKDIIYFALALYLKCSIWSNEKKLKEQNYIKIYSTNEIMKLFNLIQ